MPKKVYQLPGFWDNPLKKRENQQQLTTVDGETMVKYVRGERDDKII